jgi:hypothetical protein
MRGWPASCTCRPDLDRWQAHKKRGGEAMNIVDPKWIKAEHERQVAALVVMLQAFELISKRQRAAAAKARATLGDIEARDRARTHRYH